jgi:hypothetical protein
MVYQSSPMVGLRPMKQSSNLVIYRDEKGQQTLFFGPFVSPSIAGFFKAEMPEPLEGGFCRVVPLQPYTAQEGHIVHDHIMTTRKTRQLVPAT